MTCRTSRRQITTTPASSYCSDAQAFGNTSNSPAGAAGLRVTGVPARHGPAGSEDLVGEVTGFLLSGEGLPTVYISGDNAGLDVVAAVASRITAVGVAVLFAGGGIRPGRAGQPPASSQARPADRSLVTPGSSRSCSGEKSPASGDDTPARLDQDLT